MKKAKIKQGQFGFIRADKERPVYPEGVVVLIMSHNPHENEYQVTDLVKDTANHANPYILENEETGFKITKEQFDTGEFVPYDIVEPIDLSYQNPVIKFLQGTVAKAAIGVLLFCSGALIALEFVK